MTDDQVGSPERLHASRRQQGPCRGHSSDRRLDLIDVTSHPRATADLHILDPTPSSAPALSTGRDREDIDRPKNPLPPQTTTFLVAVPATVPDMMGGRGRMLVVISKFPARRRSAGRWVQTSG